MLPSDRDILGYSRYIVGAAAFVAMAATSPFEYAWSSMSGHIGANYGWSREDIGWLFTLFVIFQSIGALPGGMSRDRWGPRWTTAISGWFLGVGIFSLTLGPSYAPVLTLWCIGSFFAGVIYNNAVTTGNKWFPDRRGLMTGMIAGGLSWGSLPFILPIRTIPQNAPPAVFFHMLYIMAGILGGVTVIAALFLKDPPVGWRPAGWEPTATAMRRPSEHQYTVGEALHTWQMWVLIISFVLISSAGLAGISKIVQYSNSFKFAATATTVAAGGIAIANGFGKLILGGLSQRFGTENMMILSYTLCGLLLFLSIYAGPTHQELLFVCVAMAAIFFWASGGDYGILYAIAKGSGGLYGGILSTVLIMHHGFSVAIGVAGIMAIVGGLIIIPLKFAPPMWPEAPTVPVDGASGVDSGQLKLIARVSRTGR